MAEIKSEANPAIEPDANRSLGEVVKLDRKFPLVEIAGIGRVRCEHATELVKGSNERAVIGDIVEVSLPKSHTVGVIENILPRRTTFVRRDPQERETPQVLAANFDQVLIVQPINKLNLKRLERELVLAHEAGADVAILLTKADLINGDSGSFCDAGSADVCEGNGDKGDAIQGRATISAICDQVQDLAGQDVQVLAMSRDDDDSINRVRRLMSGKTTILIGKSGVGKSTLVNILLGEDARATGVIRARDGKGRHTTVSREIIALPEYREPFEGACTKPDVDEFGRCHGDGKSESHDGRHEDRQSESHDGRPSLNDDDRHKACTDEHHVRHKIEMGLDDRSSTTCPIASFSVCSTACPGGRIVDMPGVRGLGLWDAEDGIETAFADIEEMAARCRFRDCRHGAEPGCAVREAVKNGTLSEARLASYLSLRDELSRNNERRRRSSWKNK